METVFSKCEAHTKCLCTNWPPGRIISMKLHPQRALAASNNSTGTEYAMFTQYWNQQYGSLPSPWVVCVARSGLLLCFSLSACRLLSKYLFVKGTALLAYNSHERIAQYRVKCRHTPEWCHIYIAATNNTHNILSLFTHAPVFCFPFSPPPSPLFFPSPQGDIILVSEEFNDGWMRGLRLGDLEVKRGCVKYWF